MTEAKGNIWDYGGTHWIVVTTNIGWRANGWNVMGRGIASEAAEMFLDLPKLYGWFCKAHRDGAIMQYCGLAPRGKYRKLLLCPSKPLDVENPHLSWQSEASLPLIERMLPLLAAEVPGCPVAVPLIGCGNGRLDPVVVRPLMHEYLDDRFVLVEEK